MTFPNAISTCLRKYAVFNGVASRSEYWWFFLFNFLIDIVLAVLGQATIRGLVSLVLLLPSLAVGVRRMHDAGRSGWWILTTIIPPWGIYLLCTPTKTTNNPYASGYTVNESNVVSGSRACPTCGKMRLPGQTYCVGCGAKFPEG
ncbi:MAG TPA: DUF805 domain-containing protein [Acidimicrobiales bacterium]|jgi:uncharacterized membrane protein YhaH (DUF805 family)|nr:DUF805 domain-containing protein [Acidimicrobiales bacterium]